MTVTTNTVNVTVDGVAVEVPAGTLITLCIGAANRDPAQYPQPEQLDLRRECFD